MSERLIEVGNGFWNIRGDFRIGGVLNIGTQASLVRRADGRFLMLDGYTLRGELLQQVRELTDDGALLDAIIHLHPFHTVHVQAAHAQFPGAKLYGTCRHHERFPDLPWQAERSESPECAALFAGELEFSVPEGVVFVSPNENLHFSSVLAWHPASKTIHSDDTLMVLRAPGPLGRLLPPAVRFHMTLAQTLERRAGAAGAFRTWASGLATRWGAAENLCAAHTGTLLARENRGDGIADRIRGALRATQKTLDKHERRHG